MGDSIEKARKTLTVFGGPGTASSLNMLLTIFLSLQLLLPSYYSSSRWLSHSWYFATSVVVSNITVRFTAMLHLAWNAYNAASISEQEQGRGTFELVAKKRHKAWAQSHSIVPIDCQHKSDEHRLINQSAI